MDIKENLQTKRGFVDWAYFLILFLVFLILVCACYQSFFRVRSTVSLDAPVLIVGTVVYVLLLVRLRKLIHLKYMPCGKGTLLGVVLCLLWCIVLCVFANQLMVIPQYDLNSLQREAIGMVERSNDGYTSTELFDGNSYFSRYSAQIPVTILLYWVYKAGNMLGWANYSLIGGVFNSISIALAALGSFFLVRDKSTVQNALVVLMLFFTNPIFYLYASYSYTDTLCMPWAMWGCYLVLRFLEDEDSPKCKRIAGQLLGIMFLLIGYKIRATVGILLIALLLYAMVTKRRGKTALIAMVAVMFVMLSVGQSKLYEHYGFEVNQSEEFPLTHWVMMGLNQERGGWYSDSDVAYTISLPTYDEKVEGNLHVIQNRLTDMGISGTLKLLVQKLGSVWASGDCTSTTFASMSHHGILYRYTIGSSSIFCKYLLQICRCGLIVFLILAVAQDMFTAKRKISVWVIALFGAILFYLVWEVHNRYSLNFLPWLFIMVVPGIECGDRVTKRIYRAQLRHPDMKAVNGVLCAGVIVFTAGLFCCGWNAYVEDKAEYSDVIVYQRNADSGSIEDIGKDEVTQTFMTDQRFNRIELYLTKSEKV
ncbi:MAG: hypothetical protein IJX71_05435 [Oscillospiraceae bacterium]|nr:hypothetical protein [Oscillospiraceae bacterium]